MIRKCRLSKIKAYPTNFFTGNHQKTQKDRQSLKPRNLRFFLKPRKTHKQNKLIVLPGNQSLVIYLPMRTTEIKMKKKSHEA